MKLNRHTHPHVLRTFPDASVCTTEEIPLLQSLIPEIIKHEVARIINHLLELQILSNEVIRLIDYSFIKQNLCRIDQTIRRILLMIIDYNSGCKKAIIRVIAS